MWLQSRKREETKPMDILHFSSHDEFRSTMCFTYKSKCLSHPSLGQLPVPELPVQESTVGTQLTMLLFR